MSGLQLREHFEELRRRAKVVFISLVVSIFFVLFFPLDPSQLLSFNTLYWSTPVTLFLADVRNYVKPAGWQLIGLTVNSPLEVLIVAGIILGVMIDMPVIAYEAYMFINPALKEEEKAVVYPVVAAATGLFIAGVLFGYFILARFIFFALGPFFAAVGAATVISVVDFYFIVFLAVGFSGVAFTAPVFVFIVIRFGILTPEFFSKNRLMIWFATYVITAVVTPDGGPVLDIILFVPVIGLIEAAVLVGKRYAPKTPRDRGPKCGSCGKPVSPGALFCSSCGKALH